jgi:undecaprenyl diphosphate synthase
MTTKAKPETISKVPVHVAIIMDGNGRWAKSRGLPRLAGHRAGTENLRRIIRSSVEFGVKYLTIYAFSTENWDRPPDEVDGLMNIVAEVIDHELQELNRQGVQLRHLGHLDRLGDSLRSKVLHAVEITKNNSTLVLNVAFNYGGRDEILCALRAILSDGIKPEDIDAEKFSTYLFTAGIPDPDLIIRTSGEMRVSNFLIWQGAYSEWYFTPVFWPDFDREEYHKALVEFGKRDRRYGRVSSGAHGNSSSD